MVQGRVEHSISDVCGHHSLFLFAFLALDFLDALPLGLLGGALTFFLFALKAHAFGDKFTLCRNLIILLLVISATAAASLLFLLLLFLVVCEDTRGKDCVV